MMRQALLLLALAAPAGAEGTTAIVAPPEQGSVSHADGLAAWDRVHAVLSHPRCANCHVGSDNIPLWSGPEYAAPGPHGMNISAGDSRIGAETLACGTCHITSTDPVNGPHDAPATMLGWQLAPVEMVWYGQTSAQICAQMSDPDRNGGRDWIQLAEHLRDDAAHGGFVAWGFAPGGGRQPAPGDLQSHIDDVLKWGAAGQPCPK